MELEDSSEVKGSKKEMTAEEIVNSLAGNPGFLYLLLMTTLVAFNTVSHSLFQLVQSIFCHILIMKIDVNMNRLPDMCLCGVFPQLWRFYKLHPVEL